MQPPKIVAREEWLEARKKLLEEEKDFTKVRDALSARRRALPWVKLDKSYVFEDPEARVTLAELFGSKSQLIVYHFMFGPDWSEGCPSCSYLADHFDGMRVHLADRDIAFAAVSRTAPDCIEAYKARMGWTFQWVSSLGSDFNFDFGVSFSGDAKARGPVDYNFRQTEFPYGDEAPGLSVFAKDEAGAVYHTYSTYARGLDLLIGAYNFMDLMPKGRNEADLPWSMAWVRRHDQYAG